MNYYTQKEEIIQYPICPAAQRCPRPEGPLTVNGKTGGGLVQFPHADVRTDNRSILRVLILPGIIRDCSKI